MYSTINGLRFARCVKQLGFYTHCHSCTFRWGLLGVLNKMGSIRKEFLAILSNSLHSVLNCQILKMFFAMFYQ